MKLLAGNKSGFGAMLSFELAGGETAVEAFSNGPAVLYLGRILGRALKA